MATDRFPYSQSLTGPINLAFAVVPNDDDDLPEVTRSLYLGAPGAVRVRFPDGREHTYKNLIVGRHPLRVSRVFATGTTALDITGEV